MYTLHDYIGGDNDESRREQYHGYGNTHSAVQLLKLTYHHTRARSERAPLAAALL